MRYVAVLVAAFALAGVAGATAPPVKNIPAGPISTILTARGQLVSIALPHSATRSWRLARPLDPKVLREVGEADVGSNVVVVFKAFAKGKATIVYARARGEGGTADASRTYVVTIR
jgi:hypothetical protein